MEDLAGIIIPIVSVVMTFSSLIIFIYFHYTSRNRERMALIESGKDASIFKSYKEKKQIQTLEVRYCFGHVGFGNLFRLCIRKNGYTR